jgi:hypothetical protein
MPESAVISERTASSLSLAAPLHLYNWDRLRVFASLDIVGLHLTGTHLFGGLGLPTFLLISVALGVHRPHPASTQRFCSRRLQRIVLPWLFWSLAIAAGITLVASWEGQPALGWFEPRMLLYGPRIHLWFLPFIAVAGVLAHGMHRLTARLDPLLAAAGGVLLGLVSIALQPRLGHSSPFEQWSFGLPAIFLGFALGRTLAASAERRAPFDVAVLVGMALLGGALLLWLEPALYEYLRRYGGALLLLSLVLFVPNRSDRYTPHIAALMLGIYCLHPSVYWTAVEPQLWAHGLGEQQWARIGFGYTATALVVLALRQTALRRVL